MVRAPAKSCPNLSRLFDDAEPKLLSGFLASKAFERLKWLSTYTFDPDNPDGPSVAREMLRQEKKDRLGPLEDEAARIVTIASDRGEYVLQGLANTSLEPDDAKALLLRQCFRIGNNDIPVRLITQLTKNLCAHQHIGVLHFVIFIGTFIRHWKNQDLFFP